MNEKEMLFMEKKKPKPTTALMGARNCRIRRNERREREAKGGRKKKLLHYMIKLHTKVKAKANSVAMRIGWERELAGEQKKRKNDGESFIYL